MEPSGGSEDPLFQGHTYRLFCALECFLQWLPQREYDPICLPTSWADFIGSGYFLLFKLVQSSSWYQPHMWFKTVLACFRPLLCSKGAEWGVAHIPASSFSSFASPACPSLESIRVFGQGGRSGAVVCWWLFNTSSLENIPWFVVFAHFHGVNAICHLPLPWLISS